MVKNSHERPHRRRTPQNNFPFPGKSWPASEKLASQERIWLNWTKPDICPQDNCPSAETCPRKQVQLTDASAYRLTGRYRRSKHRQSRISVKLAFTPSQQLILTLTLTLCLTLYSNLIHNPSINHTNPTNVNPIPYFCECTALFATGNKHIQ